jgi:hypothetical protein
MTMPIDTPAPASLQGWTPIAVASGTEPTVEWADLRRHAFAGDALSRILRTWRAGGDAAPTRHTPLSTLAALDTQPSLDPDLIIAHASRCGSALLARLAASRPGTVMVGEPALLPQLLRHHLREGLGGASLTDVLRQAVRAQGRIRFGTERHHVLKLNSQTTAFLPALRKAFPRTPVVWLQRRPAEIVESNIENARRQGSAKSPAHLAQWAVNRVTLAFLGALAFVDEGVHVLDYRELPQAAWERVAGLMGMQVADEDLSRMRSVTGVHSHSGERFVPRVPKPLAPEVQAIVRETLDPMYETLARRGRGGDGGRGA